MARPRKKLQQSDINRNTSVEVSHTIKKIKENERKYTIVLVIIFMSIFSIIGYKLFSVDSNILFNNVSAYSKYNSYFSISSEVLTLTNKDIYSDDLGIKTEKHSINITNKTNKNKKYKIYLISENDKSNIRYSFNNIDILKLGDDNLFTEGTIKKGESINIKYNIWVNNQNIDISNEYVYKGKFIIKEI